MRVLVTGGAGFIGSNFTRFAVKRGHDVRVYDKLTYAGNLENLRDLLHSGKVELVRGDVCDSESLANACKGCDAVVHFAAETHVDRSILESGDFVRTDVVGTWCVLEVCRRNDVGRLIHISTDEVYGEATGNPCTELDGLMPKSPYAASKTGADRLAFSYVATYGMPIVISRSTNNYGPYQHVEKLIPLFVTNALENRPLPVYGTGANIRDWIHVEDHCAALELLLTAHGVNGQVFNIGASAERSVVEIGEAIIKALRKPKTLLTSVPNRPGNVLRHAVDWTKLRAQLGWVPKKPFEVGLQETIDWYRTNEWWWRPVKARDFRDYSQVHYRGQA